MMEPGRQVDDTEGLEEEPWTTTTDGRHCDETAVGMATNDGGLKKGPWTPTEDAILMYYVKNHGEGNWNAVQRNSGLARCGKSCRLRWTNHLRPDLKKGPLSPEEEQTILRLHQRFGNKWARMTDYLPGRTDNEIKNYWNTRKKRLQRAKLPLYPLEIQQHCEDNPINHPIPPSLSTTFTPFRAMVADNSSLPPLFTAAAANNSSLAAVVDNSSLPLLFEAAAAANTSFLPPVLEAAAVDINSSLPFLNHDDYLFAESLIVLYDQRKEQQKMKSLDNPFAEQQQMGLRMENYHAEPIHDLPPYLSSKMELPSAQLFSEIHDGQLLDTLLNEAQYSGETLQKEEVLPGLIIESYDEKPLQLHGETLLNEEMMMTTMMPALVIKSYGEATLPKEEMLPGFRSYDDKPLQPCEYGDMNERWLSTT